MGSVLTLALKDLLVLWRDKGALFWLLGFPTIYAVFFGSVLGGGGGGEVSGLRISATDLDRSEFSRDFLAALASGEAVVITEMSSPEGVAAVRRGDRLAHLMFESGFGDSMGFGSGVSLQVHIDPSRQAEGGFLQGQLMATWFEVLRERFMEPARAREFVRDSVTELQGDTDLNLMERAVLLRFMGELDTLLAEMESGVLSEPGTGESTGEISGEPRIEMISVARETADGNPRSSFELFFPIAMIWGMIGAVAGFAMSLVSERARGTFLRLRVSPLTTGHLLGGKALACFIACVGVMIFLLLLGWLCFGVRVDHPLALAAAMGSTALCFVGIMMLLATLGRTEESVSGSAWAVMLILGMIGGVMVPRFIMPQWMQAIGQISPMKWGVQALEGAMWRDHTWRELLPVCGVLLAIGAVCFAVGVLRLRRGAIC